MRTVSQHDAEDLMQDVFLRMANHKGLGMIENLQAFMFTTATNLLRDRWRRNNAKHAPNLVNCEDVRLEAGASDPCEILDWRERLDQINDEIARLKAKPRCAFELSRLHGRSYNEIASHMQVSVSMIEKHISCTLSRLRQAAI
jgi:RNA polymerase sigma-70 factor (ECF subfamily)